MKKILFLLLMSINFVSADVNECMNDVYFANGIDTNEEDAQESKNKIKSEFKASNPEAYKKVENWEVAYNHTHGIGADLYESMLQKMYHMTEIENRKTKGYLMFLLNLDSASGLFKYTFKGITKKIASKAPEELVKTYAGKAAKQLAKKTLHAYNKKWGKDLTEEELELIFNEVFDYLIDQSISSYIDKTRKEIEAEELADIKKHFEAYTNSIKDGHGTIVIAHSQGNLFTNMVHYNFEFTGQGWMKDYFSALGVASPANNILGESSPYITFDNDMIQLVPDSLPTNVTNPKRYFVKNALGEVIGETQYSVEAHSFLTSYMATDITKKTILDFIKEKIDIHKTRVSQWIKDQESDKNTKDYKITVKHKFDPDNIVISDKIYPFNLDGKLYPVHRAYVKASCGGKSITDVWEGQDTETEFWKINNPQEEKITGEVEFECSSAYANGYDIMATYCSYHPSDEGHFWLRNSGFMHIPSVDKTNYANRLTSQYNWCGIYGKSTINAWGGSSYCYEAHVYWSKEPVTNKRNNNQKKQFRPTYKIENNDNNDNNESYLTD